MKNHLIMKLIRSSIEPSEAHCRACSTVILMVNYLIRIGIYLPSKCTLQSATFHSVRYSVFYNDSSCIV